MAGKAASGASAERLSEEKAEQARWRPRKRGLDLAWFDRLVDGEFLTPERQRAEEARRLRHMLAFAAAEIPYYRDLFARLKLSPDEIASPQDLTLLPELTKAAIQEHEKRLLPGALPAGQKYGGSYTSSGSTGEPTRVHQTESALLLRLLLTQRQLRWYRLDPALTMATFRTGHNLPHATGRELELGETVALDGWPGVGEFFATGRFLGFLIENPLEHKTAWLERHRPAYLFVTTSNAEHLAFAFQERSRLAGLKGIRAMSEPLTQGMRARIENTFGVPVHISYGLDEVGWVATRCREGGRYHVHTEHCLVEIVDESGKSCNAGEFGRLLITTLSNPAMPLLRYVTDDIAQALDGPCPCGRTLPAFGDIVGRHSLTKNLPEGTMPVVSALRSAMEALPRELSLPVREYQVRQSRDGNFELCLILAGPRPAGFGEYAERAFEAGLAARGSAPGAAPKLAIREVAQIPRSRSLKFFHFVSEFTQPQLAKDRAEAPVADDGAAAKDAEA